MAFRMAGLHRKKSGAYVARKGIPKDVRGEYQILYGRGWEELFSMPSGETPQRAKVRFSEWQAEIDNRIESIRAKGRGQGRDLTQREAQALAGEWYRWWVGRHEENPGDPGQWRQLSELFVGAVMNATPEWNAHDPLVDQTQRAREPAVREDVHPMLADEAKTAQFLASKGEVLTHSAMTAFLDCILSDFLVACDLLERRALGDYSPDTLPQWFPKYSRGKPEVRSGRTCVQIYEDYIRSAQIAPSTVNRWRVVFQKLDEHLTGRGIEEFAEEDAQRWATSLITNGRGARTVSDIWVTAANTVFTWARSQKLVEANPFAGVSIRVPRKVVTRETQEFTDEEASLILRSALAITDTRKPFKAACRWVPWLCAYSGARAGEITQLRVQDIERRADFFAMKLTPDAGTIKNAKPRTVPLHEHIIELSRLRPGKGHGTAVLHARHEGPRARDRHH